MTLIAAYSTDWTSEPVVDELESSRQGKQVFVKDQQRLSYGGTYYYRLAMPTMTLGQQDGFEGFLSPQFQPMPDGHIECLDVSTGEWRAPDIIWMQRYMHQNAVDIYQRAIAAGQYIVNDLDDHFFALPRTNIAFQTTSPDFNTEFNRVHYRKALAASSAITCSTPALAKECESLGPPVFLCRNCIDIERWPQLDPGTDGCVGWIGGLQWRARDLEQLKVHGLPEFLATFGIPFYHGGDSPVDGVKKVWDVIGIDPNVIKVVTHPLVPIGEYPVLFQPLNISLIPLEDCRFNHGKSALKALESSASGIPYIASDLPEQRWFVEDGGMGRLVKNSKRNSWWNALEELLDPNVRRIEGAANRKHAEQWSMALRWPQWAEVFDSLQTRNLTSVGSSDNVD